MDIGTWGDRRVRPRRDLGVRTRGNRRIRCRYDGRIGAGLNRRTKIGIDGRRRIRIGNVRRIRICRRGWIRIAARTAGRGRGCAGGGSARGTIIGDLSRGIPGKRGKNQGAEKKSLLSFHKNFGLAQNRLRMHELQWGVCPMSGKPAVSDKVARDPATTPLFQALRAGALTLK